MEKSDRESQYVECLGVADVLEDQDMAGIFVLVDERAMHSGLRYKWSSDNDL